MGYWSALKKVVLSGGDDDATESDRMRKRPRRKSSVTTTSTSSSFSSPSKAKRKVPPVSSKTVNITPSPIKNKSKKSVTFSTLPLPNIHLEPTEVISAIGGDDASSRLVADADEEVQPHKAALSQNQYSHEYAKQSEGQASEMNDHNIEALLEQTFLEDTTSEEHENV